MTMKTTIAGIGALTVLIGGLVTAPADEHRGDTLSKEAFERAAAVLRKGAAEGTISEAAARAGIEGMRASMRQTDRTTGANRPMTPAHARAVHAEIRKAVAEGRMTEEEARKKAAWLRRRMQDRTPGDSQRNPHEIHAQTKAALMKAVESGRITEEQARERLQTMRRKQAARDDRTARDAYARAEDAIEKMVEEGTITVEQARERLRQMRERVKNND